MGKTGHLIPNEIKFIVEDSEYTGIDTFVETGTYIGMSTLEASKTFKNCHTIEIVEDLSNQAKENCKSANNIVFHVGNSLEVLPDLVPQVNTGCFWFIDAHHASPETGFRGQHAPLLTELELILDNLNSGYQHIFVFDDVRLFAQHWDWEKISLFPPL